MSGSYSFTQGAFDRMEQALFKANDDIDHRVTQLEIYAKSVLGGWSGDAKVEYEVHKTEWDNNILRMRSIIREQAVPALRNILENYMLTERKNKQSWGPNA
jgi:uncharacterized protein YukE